MATKALLLCKQNTSAKFNRLRALKFYKKEFFKLSIPWRSIKL